MQSEKINPAAIRAAFQFLVDEYGYMVVRDEQPAHEDRRYAFVIEYQGNDRRVLLNHDYKENFFYFSLIRGLDTKYPNEQDHKNILSFWGLFRSFEPELKLDSIQPVQATCVQAARHNAELLRKYCSGILRGEEWV